MSEKKVIWVTPCVVKILSAWVNMEKQQSAESRVTDLVEEIISLDTLETSFNLFLVHRKETEDQKRQGRVNDFLDILRTCKAGYVNTYVYDTSMYFCTISAHGRPNFRKKNPKY